jgi:hypothetical protein
LAGPPFQLIDLGLAHLHGVIDRLLEHIAGSLIRGHIPAAKIAAIE